MSLLQSEEIETVNMKKEENSKSLVQILEFSNDIAPGHEAVWSFVDGVLSIQNHSELLQGSMEENLLGEEGYNQIIELLKEKYKREDRKSYSDSDINDGKEAITETMAAEVRCRARVLKRVLAIT